MGELGVVGYCKSPARTCVRARESASGAGHVAASERKNEASGFVFL